LLFADKAAGEGVARMYPNIERGHRYIYSTPSEGGGPRAISPQVSVPRKISRVGQVAKQAKQPLYWNRQPRSKKVAKAATKSKVAKAAPTGNSGTVAVNSIMAGWDTGTGSHQIKSGHGREGSGHGLIGVSGTVVVNSIVAYGPYVLWAIEPAAGKKGYIVCILFFL